MTYLILRLSTLGNVAMTVPVVASLSVRYPEHQWIVVAQKPLGAMFHGLQNVRYHEVSPQLLRSATALYRSLQGYHPDAVFDLHGICTTRLVGWLFRLHGVPVYTIDNHRRAQLLLKLRGAKGQHALPTAFERYAETFRKGRFVTDAAFVSLPLNEEARDAVRRRFGQKSGRWIGIAPFAKSKSNMLPYRVMKEVIQHLTAQANTRIFLFGAGKIECEMLRQWASVFPNTESVAGCLPLSEELELMRQLDVMLCMDSANQHLASLVQLRAVSIWCATHPYMGFAGWKQSAYDILQRTELNCRPCTCHGTNHCRYRNFACKEFTAHDILSKLLLHVSK